MKKIIILSSLAATAVSAQMTGDFGRQMVNKGLSFNSVLSYALIIGLTLLVWLWVAKLWKELSKK